MDQIDNEIAAIRALWDDEEFDARERAEAARRERMELKRERLRKGLWKPLHRCDVCIRAILELRPDMVCPVGKTQEQWWL